MMKRMPTILALGFVLLATFAGAAESAKAKGAPKGQRPLPPGVTALRDLPYSESGHERQKLDLYLPANATNAPLVVWVHGGGWQNGGKDRSPALMLLTHGYAVASINYRLSSHAQFPAQIEDCKAAVRWLRGRAGQYGYDPDRIAAWGSSAGGHLVALLGVTGDAKDFERGEHLDVSSRVQAVVNFYGPSELLTMDTHSRANSKMKHNAPDSPEAKLLGGLIQEHKEKAKRASPIHYVTSDDAPMLLVHGDSDPLVPMKQSEVFYAALKNAGVDASLYIVKGGGHGGFNDPEVERQVTGFLNRVLKVTPR